MRIKQTHLRKSQKRAAVNLLRTARKEHDYQMVGRALERLKADQPRGGRA